MSRAERPAAIFVLRCGAGEHLYFSRQVGLFIDAECDHCAASARLRGAGLDELAWRAVIGLQSAWTEDQKALRGIVRMWGWGERKHGAGVVVTPHGVLQRAGAALLETAIDI